MDLIIVSALQVCIFLYQDVNLDFWFVALSSRQGYQSRRC